MDDMSNRSEQSTAGDKFSSSATTMTPVDSPALSPSRSRRPTYTTLSPSPTNLPPLMEAPGEQAKQKWTVRRIAVVTWNYVTTLKGFLITIYFLNVVAWGGMLFLLLVEAAPAMCKPTCNDLYSARRIWIEIDSQILNALFCVTGLGLLPWRGRDLYLLQRKNYEKLAVIHQGWYIHGVTRLCLLYWVVWLFIMNSVWQIIMAVTMWSMNRFQRPGWVTGVCIAISFLCAIFAGGIEWWEVRRRKKLQKLGIVAPPLEELQSHDSMVMEEKGNGDRAGEMV